MDNRKRYILEEIITPTYKWYVCDLMLDDTINTVDNDWVLHHSCTQNIKRAMKFSNKRKAERIAAIIADQCDEMGGCNFYKIKEVK